MVTGIGSFPFEDIDEAIDLIFGTCREIPFWPQLPKRASYENMYVPFLESTPCVIVNEGEGTLYMNTEKTEGIEAFYEDFFNENLESFAISERLIPGFYRFLERLKEIEDDIRYVKCQLTGPFSMGLGLKDEQGKAIIYNSSFFDIIKKTLHMRARWMISRIKESYPAKDVIIFFDEPYLVSFGSAYVSISREEAVALLSEVLGGIDAKRGIHCCGNTDWSVLFNADVDLVNYDAVNYLDTIFYFQNDLERYLARGGEIAPGIVPSSEKVLEISLNDILKLGCAFVDRMNGLESLKKGRKDYLFTTSCGLGSLKSVEATRAMEFLRELSRLA
jgi:hypothetical protein